MVKTKSKPKKGKAKSTKGLSVQTFKGLNKKRMSAAQSGGVRVILKAGETVSVQFLTKPEGFKEYKQHSFQEDGSWTYVPCAGKKVCPLCQDEDEDRSKASYQFVANVYNLNEKKVQVLKGGTEMATQIFYRYERKATMFLKRTFEITRFDGKRTTYDVAVGEDPPVKVDKLKEIDLDEYLNNEMTNYYGQDLPESSVMDDDEDEDDEDVDDDDTDDDDDDDDSDDDDDDDDEDEDEDDEDEDDDEDDDDDDEDDEEEDDDDEDDDDEDDDEDDEPPAKSKKAVKKTAKSSKKSSKTLPAKKVGKSKKATKKKK